MKFELFDSHSLNFVELNTTGNEDDFNKCDEESKFLETVIFNVFIDCFEKSYKLYDYIVPTRYNSRSFIPLLNELTRKEEELNQIDSSKLFDIYIRHTFLGEAFIEMLKKEDPKWEKNWNNYQLKLIKICKEIQALVQICIDEERHLWVIGY